MDARQYLAIDFLGVSRGTPTEEDLAIRRTAVRARRLRREALRERLTHHR